MARVLGGRMARAVRRRGAKPDNEQRRGQARRNVLIDSKTETDRDSDHKPEPEPIPVRAARRSPSPGAPAPEQVTFASVERPPASPSSRQGPAGDPCLAHAEAGRGRLVGKGDRT